MKSNIVLAIIFFSFINSCSDRENVNSSSKIYDNQNKEIDSLTLNKVDVELKIKKQDNFSAILEKMNNNLFLSEQEYKSINNFLLNNKDESFSEEVGYTLFQYFRQNHVNCSNYTEFLKKENKKDEILCSLVQIMCIDIGEENYTYEKFIQDFSFMSGNVKAKKSFTDCMNNQ